MQLVIDRKEVCKIINGCPGHYINVFLGDYYYVLNIKLPSLYVVGKLREKYGSPPPEETYLAYLRSL